MLKTDYIKALELITELHKKYRSTINPAVKDRRLAIYYLQGGCITQANISISAWANGDLNTPFRSKRFIDECKLLIICLVAVKDPKRYVDRFFQDEIVEIKPRKHESEILSATGMDKSEFETWLKHGGTLNHGFSKGVHPTFEAVAYNTDIDTGEFNYDSKKFAFYPMRNFDFGHYVIIPTIDAITLVSGAFGIDKKDLSEIYELREKIQKSAIKTRSSF